MDIWAWVDKLTDELEEAGEERVASLFYRLSSHVVDQEIAQAEAILPEAMAAAKAMENPWAEVFFRHWEMRLRLGLKGEGESALPDVVDLLDFAHSPACEACPQTMCTTQDIASCYANIDAPGWAEERRAVAMEGIAKITPEWNCYGCLYHQYIQAFVAEKRYTEALEAYEKYEADMLGAGKEIDASDLMLRSDILLYLGRNDAALTVLDEAAKHPDMEHDGRRRMGERLGRTAVYTALGRVEDAWDVLPEWNELVPGDYEEWLEAAGDIAAAAPEHNTWGLGSCFQKGLAHHSEVGAHRAVINLGKRAVELAIARGSYSTPRRVMNLMRRHLPKLRAPLGADAMLETLEEAVRKLTPPPLPVPAAELITHIREIDHPNAEEGLDWIYAALEELPDDTALLMTACSALSAMNAEDEARELLWDFIRRNPESSEDAVDAIIRYTPHDMSDDLHALADHVEEKMPHMAHWTRLYIAYRAWNAEDVKTHAERFIALKPDSIGARMISANTSMHTKEFAEAARLREEIVAIGVKLEDSDVNSYRWDLLVAATCAGNWKLVRDTCIAMEFEVEPGDTPIDDPGQYIRLRYEEDGAWLTALAQRNGPVTARVISGFWPRQVQRTQDLVVFDPELLEPYPEDEEEREYFYPPYRLVHTLQKGNFQSWLVDGFYPGQEEFSRLREALEERGFFVDSRCESDYTIADPDWQGDPASEAGPIPEGEDAPFPPPGRLDGIYFLLSAPATFPPMELDSTLTEETKTWEHPLVWLDLAKAAGRNPERHQTLIERYGL
ncbi:MAG: hypothetical protein DELT_01080 [Desulfovibrio sp.]